MWRRRLFGLASIVAVLPTMVLPVLAADNPWAIQEQRATEEKPLFEPSSTGSDTASAGSAGLFSDSLFQNATLSSQLHSDVSPSKDIQKGASAQEKMKATAQNELVFNEMRDQMQQVAKWLYVYGTRNHSFPGLRNEETWAAEVQLNELVPNNPYASDQQTWVAGVSGMPYMRNPDNSIRTFSPVYDDPHLNYVQVQSYSRVTILRDYSLTEIEVNGWADNPPDDWRAEPGTITALGNDQGYFIVWGADADGKPIKSIYNGKTFIIAANTYGTVNDQSGMNEGGVE